MIITVRLVYRAKLPVKVHVWGGISRKGTVKLCIFEGIMDRYLYVNILKEVLAPSIASMFHASHRFVQDNDPKHTSLHAREYMVSAGINWWKTPPESPDLNPIENLWHEMKEYIRREVKPTTKEELVKGIESLLL